MTADATPSHRPLPTLVLSAVLVVAEAAVILAVGVSVLLSSVGARIVLDVTTAVFFLGYAAGLLACARGLWRHRTWSRGPVVFAQLIQLGVAWSFFSGSTRPVAVALLVSALAVLGLVLAPSSTQVLRRRQS